MERIVRYIIVMLMLCLKPTLAWAQLTVEDEDGYDEDPYFLLSGEADKAIAEGDYTTAAERINEAINLKPENPGNIMLLSNLGTVYNYLDRDTLALDAYNRALALAPSMTVILVNRGRLLLKMGKSTEAFQDFTDAIERDSCNVSARYYHGLMSLYGGDRYGAEADFGVLESEDPNSYSTAVALATLYSMTGRERQAIPYYKDLISQDPAAEYYGALAGCYLALDELSEASATIADGLSTYPMDPELYYYRAWLNRERYQIKEAKDDALTAIALGANRKKVDALFE